jgi:hypothetical protein
LLGELHQAAHAAGRRRIHGAPGAT